MQDVLRRTRLLVGSGTDSALLSESGSLVRCGPPGPDEQQTRRSGLLLVWHACEEDAGTAKRHTKDTALEVIRELAAQMGADRVRREHVQEALKDRAAQLGMPPVGVDNRLVGPLLDQVRDEARQARLAAAEAATADVDGMPARLRATLTRSTEAVEQACRQTLADLGQRLHSDAEARIAQVQVQAAAGTQVLEADLAAARADRDDVAAELEETAALLADRERRAEELSADLAERTAAVERLQRELREQVALLNADLRRSRTHREAAEERARRAEQRASEAVATLARLEERHGALEWRRIGIGCGIRWCAWKSALRRRSRWCGTSRDDWPRSSRSART